MHRCCGENLEGPLFNILLSRLQTSIKFNEAKSFLYLPDLSVQNQMNSFVSFVVP